MCVPQFINIYINIKNFKWSSSTAVIYKIKIFNFVFILYFLDNKLLYILISNTNNST